MMTTTGQSKTNFFTRRLLTTSSLKDHMLDYLESGQIRALKMMTTGQSTSPDAGAFFLATAVTDGSSGSTLDFQTLYGTDGTGKLIDLATGETTLHTPYFTNVPFEDTSAATYFLGVKSEEIPVGIAHDATTGTLNYDRHKKILGMDCTVVSFSYNNSTNQSTITFVPNNCAVSTDYTGRTAVIYKINPESSDAGVAIKTVTITQSATLVNHKAVFSGNLGQTGSGSTTASDYAVMILGPMITTNDISPDSGLGVGYAFIGTVVGGNAPRTFDFTEQVEIEPMSNSQNRVKEITSNGWLVKPTITSIVNAEIILQQGSALINGTAQNVPAATINATSLADGQYFIFWSPSTQYDFLTASDANFDACQSGNRVLVGFIDLHTVGGTKMFRDRGLAFKSVKDFDRQIRMTLCANPTEIGAFSTIEEALGICFTISQRTSTDVAFEIEVKGMISVDADEFRIKKLFHLIPNIRWVGAGIASGQSYKFQKLGALAGQSFYGFEGAFGTVNRNKSGFIFNHTTTFSKGGFHFHHQIVPGQPNSLEMPVHNGIYVAAVWSGWEFDNIVFQTTVASDSQNQPKSFFYAAVLDGLTAQVKVFTDITFKNCSFLGSSHEQAAITRQMGRVGYVVNIPDLGALNNQNSDVDSVLDEKELVLASSRLRFLGCDGVMDYGLVRAGLHDAQNPVTFQPLLRSGGLELTVDSCKLIVTGQQSNSNLQFITTGRKQAVIDITSNRDTAKGDGWGLTKSVFTNNQVTVIPQNTVTGNALQERDPQGMGFIYSEAVNRDVTIENNKLTFERGVDGIAIIGLGIGTVTSGSAANESDRRANGVHIVNNVIQLFAPSTSQVAEDTTTSAQSYGAISLLSVSDQYGPSGSTVNLGGGNTIIGNKIMWAHNLGDMPQNASFVDYTGIRIQTGGTSPVVGTLISNNTILAGTGIRIFTNTEQMMMLQVHNNNISCTANAIVQVANTSTLGSGGNVGVQVSNNNITVGTHVSNAIHFFCSAAQINNNVIFHEMPGDSTASTGGPGMIVCEGRDCTIQGNTTSASHFDLRGEPTIVFGNSSTVTGNRTHRAIGRLGSTPAFTNCVISNNVWEAQRQDINFMINLSNCVISNNVIRDGSQTKYSIVYGANCENLQFNNNILTNGMSMNSGALDSNDIIDSSVIQGNICQPNGGTNPAASFDISANTSVVVNNVVTEGDQVQSNADTYMRVRGDTSVVSQNIASYITSWQETGQRTTVDPDFLNKSIISGNIAWKGWGDFQGGGTASLRNGMFYIEESVFMGNYGGFMTIQHPRNESSTGLQFTGGRATTEGGFSTLMGNITSDGFQMSVQNSSLIGNIFDVDQMANPTSSPAPVATVNNVSSFTIDNVGTSGGSIGSRKLCVIGNQFGMPFRFQNSRATFVGNMVSRFCVQFGPSSNISASIYFESTATTGINAIGNVTDTGVVIDQSVTAATISAMGNFTTDSIGRINAIY